MKKKKLGSVSMAYIKLMTEDHEGRLPFVRIKKVELANFKGVKHGILEFNCAKEFIPYDTKSDIMGIYGQNGSGKSSLVDALDIIKGLISGARFDEDDIRFIDVDSDYAQITVTFDFQYTNGVSADVEYSVELAKVKNVDCEMASESDGNDCEYHITVSKERISTQLYADGSVKRSHVIIDTGTNILCGDTVFKEWFGQNALLVKEELLYLKRKSYEDCRSFVFNPSLARLLGKEGSESKYREILIELYLFASRFLHVIESRSSGLVQLGIGIPIFLPSVKIPLFLAEDEPIPAGLQKHIQNVFDQINVVIGTIIPDLQLELNFSPTTSPNGEPGVCTSIYSVRGNRKFPFAYESDGIIKIVCILADYIVAFNQGSTTLVVDEFDSGIFEYLLGELLQVFEESGKGQFIFTSHNLRPLEVIDKKFIRFTTYDPFNRYYRLPNVGGTNNLRDIYLRKVQLGNDEVEIYRRTKNFKIVKALRTAGGGFFK